MNETYFFVDGSSGSYVPATVRVRFDHGRQGIIIDNADRYKLLKKRFLAVYDKQ